MTDRAMEACRNYVHWQQEIKRLTGEIAFALAKCPGIKGTLLVDLSANGDETHLADVYRGYTEDDPYGPEQRYYSEEEAVEYLSVCEHCLSAHRSIQERKVARQKFGAAKRWIVRTGKGKT
jgi:hypothetical protein